jgi:hypothetical protein
MPYRYGSTPMKRKVGTQVIEDKRGMTHVKLYDTNVVSFSQKHIILRTGGWNTATTARRMEEASQEYGLGIASVGRHKGKMRVGYRGELYEFVDNIMLPR